MQFKPGDYFFQTNENRSDYGVVKKVQETDSAHNLHSIIKADIRAWRYLNSKQPIEPPSEEIWDTFEIGDIVYAPQFFKYPFILNEWEVFGMEIDEYGIPLTGLRPIIFKTKDKEVLEAMFFIKLEEFVNMPDFIPEKLQNFSSCLSQNECLFFDELGYPKYRLEFNHINNNAYVYKDDEFEYSHDLVKAIEHIENNLFAMNAKELQILHDKAAERLLGAFPKAEFMHMSWSDFGSVLTTYYYVDGLVVVFKFGLYGRFNRIYVERSHKTLYDNLTLDELIPLIQNQIGIKSFVK